MEVGTVRRIDIEQTMRSAYLSYAMSVITARALPDVRDGLKPVQRRILYAMWDMGLRHEQPPRKSARIVGEVLGKYHPHGDVAVYDAMVRMAQDFAMRYVLVDGQGNFGSVDGDGAAAMRYTEARLSALGEEMLVDLEKNTVSFAPNFDGSLQEPNVLPAKVPNLLVNGVNGIAVGMATNIPPHNLGEVVDALVHLIDRYDDIEDVSVEELMRFLPGPDFPSAGTILGVEGIQQAYATGKGSLLVRAQAHIEEMRGGHSAIIVTELPYQVNKAGLIERIAELVRDGRLEGIGDLRDESDRRTGMRVVVELKRGQEPTPLLSQLLKQTQMQTTFGVNMLALVDGEPRVLPLKRILAYTIDHRHDVLVRRTQYELDRALARAHILQGLITALDHLDEVIDTIRRSRTADTAQQNLIAKFKLTEIQARAILDLQLRRLAALERRKIEEEYQEILKRIDYLRDLLGSRSKVLALIKEELLDLKQRFGDLRRTRLSVEAEDKEFRPEDLLPDEEIVVVLASNGTVLRLPLATFYERFARGALLSSAAGAGRESLVLQAALQAHSRETILFLTDQGRAFGLAAHQLPDGSQQGGQPLANLLHLAAQERIVAVYSVVEFREDRFLFLATREGKVKRLVLSEAVPIVSSGLQVIGLEDKDIVVGAAITSGRDDVLLLTQQGKAIRFQEDTVRPQGRLATGMRGISLKEDEQVVALVAPQEAADLMLVTARGYAKRTLLAEFPAQGRGGQGVFALDVSKSQSTGPVVGAIAVAEDQEVVLSTAAGSSSQVRAGDVPRLERGSWGRLVTKSGRGAVVAVGNDHVVTLTMTQLAAKPSGEAAKSTARKRAASIKAREATLPDNGGTPQEPERQASRSDRTLAKAVAGDAKPAGESKPTRRSRAKPEPEPPQEKAKTVGGKSAASRPRAAAEATRPEDTKPGADATKKARGGKAAPQAREAKSSKGAGTGRMSGAAAEPETPPTEPKVAKSTARKSRARTEPDSPPEKAKPATAGRDAAHVSGATGETHSEPAAGKVKARARARQADTPTADAQLLKNEAAETSLTAEPEALPVEQAPAPDAAQGTARRTRRPTVTKTPRRTRSDRTG